MSWLHDHSWPKWSSGKMEYTQMAHLHITGKCIECLMNLQDWAVCSSLSYRYSHHEGGRAGPNRSCVSAGFHPLFMLRLAHVWTLLLWHFPLHNPVQPHAPPSRALLMSWTWIIGVSLSRLRIFPSLSSYKNPHLCRWTRFCHGRLRGTDCTRLNVARGD